MWPEQNGQLTKTFTFNNFVEAVDFVNKIVPLAEAMQHHPDIHIHDYKQVTVSLKTHSENAITDKDHALADQIDALEK